MIRTVCLNPVIDRSYYIEEFEPGKKYFNLCREVSIGGKGINVAKVCRQCVEQVMLYGYIAGTNGEMIRECMSQKHIDSFLLEVQGNTRETINLIDLINERETELVEDGPAVEQWQIEHLLDRLYQDLKADDIVVCSGMTIKGAPKDFYGRISRLCMEKNSRCFLDTNSVTLEQIQQSSYYFYKPNLIELFEVFDMDKSEDVRTIIELACRLVKMGVQYVLVSLGADGGVLVGNGFCYQAVIPKVDVVSTIGSGDSVVAGFAVGIERGWDMVEVFKYSMACGMANSMQKEIGRVDLDIIEQIKGRIEVLPIKSEEEKDNEETEIGIRT